jgi:hypothetical protein
MLKGPTGCGKSRFVEYMAWKLGKPLVSVACNEDMTAADLVGRFLLDAGQFDMNQIARMNFDDEDRAQFAQLIGYSVSGYGDLSYASAESVAAADAIRRWRCRRRHRGG